MSLLFFILCVYGMVAITGDFYTTMLGLDKGLGELNPINRWLFKKIGLQMTAWLEGVGYVFLSLLLANYSLGAASMYCGVLGAFETWMYIRNKNIISKLK